MKLPPNQLVSEVIQRVSNAKTRDEKIELLRHYDCPALRAVLIWNFEEKVNDPIIKKLSDYKIKWKTFSDEKETCNYHLNKLFYENKWSTYGQFK